MQEVTEKIQPYEASTDAASVFALWQNTVGQQWPLDFARFQLNLSAPGSQHFIVREKDEVIGFVATRRTQNWGMECGHLLLVLIAHAWQRQGIGSALCARAFQHLSSTDAQICQLGGNSPRFWCGVPENLAVTLPFFQAQGWESFELVYDLTQGLHNYTTAPAIYQRMLEQQITLEAGRQEDMAEVLAFEQREFPNWLMLYENSNQLGDYQDILVARDLSKDGAVVGTLSMNTTYSHPQRPELLWPGLLGEDVGAMGAVGVAVDEQGRGIGLAMCARASDLLKARGVGTCYIDWVEPETTHFYEKLGYVKWRMYHTSWRGL